MGFALLFALSALAAFAALAVVVRARLRGRAEVLVAASLIWNALIVAPIYAVGLTNHLWPSTVALGALVSSSAAFWLASRGVGARALARATVDMLRGLLRMPIDALALCRRPFRFVFLGVLLAGLMLLYLAVSAYLGQPLPRWDPLWYHDTIVGFTIQNHGFSMVDLPDTLQKVNGYVRLGEMTQLWLVIFADRRLADISNLLFAPAIAAATYTLARRYTGRVIAIGWGVAVILMPACSNYLHGTYVDPQNAALVLGAIVFATIERPRLRDGALAGLGLALAIGSKGLALVSVPAIGLVGAVILLRDHWHTRRRDALAVVAGSAVLIIATAASTYLRNYWAFHNPLWPDMRVEIPSLGIHWPGQGPWANEMGQGGGTPVNLNESLPKLLDHLYALPFSVKGMYFDQAVEYGSGIVWVALPLGVLGFFATLWTALHRRLGHLAAAEAAPPLAIALIFAVMIAGSPALWGPRYHVAHVGLLVVLAAWFTRRPAWQGLEEAAVSAVIITSFMMFWWTPASSQYFLTPARLLALAKATPLEREVDKDLGAPTTLSVGLLREKELKPGTLLVFDEHYSASPSLFWNTKFSNRVKFVRGGPGFLDRAAKEGATWISLSPLDAQLAAARAPGSGWQEVGELNPYVTGIAFRRVAPGPQAAAPKVPAPAAPRPAAPPAVAAPRPGAPPAVAPPRPGARPKAPPAPRPMAPARGPAARIPRDQ